MIDDLIKHMLFEKLGRQMVGKLLYSACISLALYLFVHPTVSFDSFPLSLAIPLTLAVFLLSTILFHHYLNKEYQNALLCTDIRKVREKRGKIFMGGHSLLDDIRPSDNKRLVVLGFTSGISSFILLVVGVYTFLAASKLGSGSVFLFFVLSLVYVMYDSLSSGYVEVEDKGGYLADLVEKYAITNTLAKISDRGAINILSKPLYRVLAPPAQLDVPKIKFDSIHVYKDNRIFDFLENRLGSEFQIKHEDGLSLGQLRTITNCEKATSLIEKSPIENFPYIIDPDYKFTGNNRERWSFISISRLEKEKSKMVGGIFIHCFKGAKIKRKIKVVSRARVKYEYKPSKTLLFMFFGEKSVVEYVKSEIELISPKVPQDILNIEIEPDDC